METLKEKNVILTGATGGIGSSIARLLALEGAHLHLLGRDQEKLEALEAELRGLTKVETYVVDLRMEEEVQAFIHHVRELDIGIDLLINNSALFAVAPIEDFSMDAFDEILIVNLRAVFQLCRGLISELRKKPGAHIINISSISAHHGWSGGGAYCASKFALNGLSQSLSEELRPDGIRVSIVSPGQVDTQMSELEADDPARELLLSPDDIAEVVLCTAKLSPNAYIPEIIIRPMETGA